MVGLQEGGGIAKVPWLCCMREEALLSSCCCASGGKMHCQDSMAALQEEGGIAKVPWGCCRWDKVRPKSYGGLRHFQAEMCLK